jgi:hypothetical protein
MVFQPDDFVRKAGIPLILSLIRHYWWAAVNHLYANKYGRKG